MAMNFKAKQVARREMLGCASEARYLFAHGHAAEAMEWSQKAAYRLFQLGGMCGNW